MFDIVLFRSSIVIGFIYSHLLADPAQQADTGIVGECEHFARVDDSIDWVDIAAADRQIGDQQTHDELVVLVWRGVKNGLAVECE
jgi:hypothetical protein